jgi:monoamine oxidase
MDAAGLVGIGVALKLLLHFDTRVVPGKLHGVVCADTPFPEFWFRDLPPTAAEAAAVKGLSSLAVGYLMGPFGEKAREIGQEAAVAAALAQIDEMFPDGPKAPQHLIKEVLHDWAAEPWIQMAYTHCEVGHSEQMFRELAKPLPNGRVMFAGEAYCSEGANMSVHCAFEAGHRAAREAVDYPSAKAGSFTLGSRL